ncbi:MAG TPA: GNAT family N-acetyltransferase [Ignavibacteria bacterium]
MKVTPLTENLIPSFKEYFKTYAHQQDESFPPDEDYVLRSDEPAYLLIDSDNKIAGAAELMMHKEYIEAKTARFRMFHCIEKDYHNYKKLLDAILKHTKGVNDIYCFVEDKCIDTCKVWERLGFNIKRYSFVLKRDIENITPSEFPKGYSLKTFNDGFDERAWCDIINESFANMQGHVHMYPEKLNEWRREPSYIKGGMKMLWHDGKPVGTMALIKESENGEDVIFIEAVGLLNSYQGRGLGKNMLRAGVEFGKNFGANSVMLSVNAENEKAADLYLKEGFKKEAVIICYSLKVNQSNI